MSSLTASEKREARILSVLATGGKDFGYFNFNVLSSKTKIERRQVRLDVRRMARKGWAQFSKGLCTEDGELYGAGYAITPAGRNYLVALKLAGKA